MKLYGLTEDAYISKIITYNSFILRQGFKSILEFCHLMTILIEIIYLIGFKLNIIAFIVYYRDFNTLWDVILALCYFFSPREVTVTVWMSLLMLLPRNNITLCYITLLPMAGKRNTPCVQGSSLMLETAFWVWKIWTCMFLTCDF